MDTRHQTVPCSYWYPGELSVLTSTLPVEKSQEWTLPVRSSGVRVLRETCWGQLSDWHGPKTGKFWMSQKHQNMVADQTPVEWHLTKKCPCRGNGCLHLAVVRLLWPGSRPFCSWKRTPWSCRTSEDPRHGMLKQKRNTSMLIWSNNTRVFVFKFSVFVLHFLHSLFLNSAMLFIPTNSMTCWSHGGLWCLEKNALSFYLQPCV